MIGRLLTRAKEKVKKVFYEAKVGYEVGKAIGRRLRGAINLGSLPNVVMLFAVAVLITSAAALALNSFKGSLESGSIAYNITEKGEQGLLNLSGQYGTIGTIIGVAVLIGIVVGAFMLVRR